MICWYFSLICIYPIFFNSANLHHGQGNWLFFKNNQSKLSNSTLKIQLLIHHPKLIWHGRTYWLNLKIKTSLKSKQEQHLKYRWHQLMCNTTKKITLIRPHQQPLIWRNWILHWILHLLSYTQQLNYPHWFKKIMLPD